MKTEPAKNRISIVASDMLVSALLKRIIMNNISGCSVKIFDNFHKLKDDGLDFNIILIDGQMAGSSGSEIINYLRFKRKNISRIIFLGYSEYDKNKALLLGANHVISKPIPLGELIELIKINLN